MEAEIIHKVQSGNAEAFSYLVNRYKNSAFSVAIKMMKNYHDAEEIVQDSFVKAYKNINKFEGKSAFSTWLFTIVYRTCLNKLGTKKYAIQDIDDSDSSSYHFQEKEQFSNMQYETRKKYLKLAMESLKELDYVLINLFYWEEQSIQEIATVTSLKESAVKVRLMRARKKLYTELSRLLKGELEDLL